MSEAGFMSVGGKSDKKIIFSGVQPTGVPHLGNYLGALKNWAQLQDEYSCIYCIVDLHSITLRQEPDKLRKMARNLLTLCLAVGIDPEKSVIYYQSHVPAHAELSWILNCFTYMGELSRMTQYKEKSQKHADNINSGLFTYPVLMAADILLFRTDMVPVGEDQRQHLELCRDVAMRFNGLYGDVFVVPQAHIAKTGRRVMSLQNPERKMSKSESDTNGNSTIFLLDPPEVVRNKIKRAVTDSDNTVRYAQDKPGISNLLDIYSAVTDIGIAEAEARFSGVGYGEFKLAVADAVNSKLAPIQERYKELSEDKAYIDRVIKDGAEKASYAAARTIRKVHKKLGFPPRG